VGDNTYPHKSFTDPSEPTADCRNRQDQFVFHAKHVTLDRMTRRRWDERKKLKYHPKEFIRKLEKKATTFNHLVNQKRIQGASNDLEGPFIGWCLGRCVSGSRVVVVSLPCSWSPNCLTHRTQRRRSCMPM
jgi:hypothetical protein